MTRSDPRFDPAPSQSAEEPSSRPAAERARLAELGLDRALPAEALAAVCAAVEALVQADDAIGRGARDAPEAAAPEDDEDGTRA